ncbi:hypothetical protein DCC85_01345 [Paenibacillus sp. CAA11]|uniref:hypothetical protein n=1 Tax=Paenibacillus sp. CAA11 TaxID=1532905 RepID=UPI000D3670B3|nr:hypothetical protein [Paenibacillus sp. CAA11]AWB43009.1 hypothetical protein DCC85_01345 [Paenibacillus sp. CAA11]
MSRKQAIYSTGILRRPGNVRYALVDVVNLNRTTSRNVTVEVFDWSSGSPVALQIQPTGSQRCKVKVGPNQTVYLYADISNVRFKYEVRVSRILDRRLIANVFGVTNVPYAPQEGGTVLQRNLVKINRVC